MRTFVLGLACVAAIHGYPVAEDDKGNFKFPGGDIPGNFLEAREPDTLNGIYNKGGYGIGKSKREDKPAGSSGSGNPMEQITGQWQNMFNQVQGMGGNMPFLQGSSNKNKREDKPAEGSTGGSSGGNPMEQITSQWQNVINQMQGMGGNMPFLSGSNSNKNKREDKPAEGSSGGSSGGNPMSQLTSQWQSVINQMQGMGGNMPFLQGSSNKNKREDKPAEGSTGGSSGGNPMEQITSQWQNVINQMQGMGGNMPFLSGGSSNKNKREDKPAEGSSGGSSGGNPMEQITSQWQSVINQMQGMGGNMPFLSSGSNKNKREDKPAEGSSGGSSGGNPMEQITSQWQNVINQMQGMGGNMPFLSSGSNKNKREDKPAEGSSGGSSGGNPMEQITSQWQNVINQMQGMGGNMPFLSGGSDKNKREDKPAEGSSGGSSGGNPMEQITSQWQNVINQMQGMGGNMPFLSGGSNKNKREDKPAEGSSGGSSGGNPMEQITSQWQNVINQMQGMGGNMPFLSGGSNKNKREDKPAEGSSGGSSGGNPMEQITSQWQNVINQMQGMGGNMPFLSGGSNKNKREDKPAEGSSGGSSGGNPMTQLTSQWQSVINQMQGMGGNMPFLQGSSNKNKREDKPAEGSTGGSSGGNPMEQITSQWQNVINQMQGMGGNMPFLSSSSNKNKREDKPAEGSSSGSGSSGNPMGQITQQWQSVINQMQGMGGNMPFLSGGSNKNKRSEESGSSPASGGSSGGNPMEQITSQWQNVINQMQGMGGNMPFLQGSSNKNKRSEESGSSAASGGSGGSSGGNPMEQITSQWQNVMNQMQGMGGNMPFLSGGNKNKREDKPAEGSSSGGSSGGNPMGQITQQWQNVINQMQGMGGNMPFLQGNSS
ncbi:Hypothetical protein NTJ_13304 [Nesidiocoris tenuis]|uniref:Uncharacterized protein n=1 Tax=Nesidiocoris tenuis TaxID=355587 RepID=A0ABN7BA36_9HEMI|nr:Hypothetical protein NTJ_13304 [Nesidiocoris tenuis]